MKSDASPHPNRSVKDKLRWGLAILGPLAAITIVGWRISEKPDNVHFYFADVRVALFVFFWLVFGLVQSLWLGSAADPRRANWIVDAPRSSVRVASCARQFTIGTLLTCVVVAILVKLFHVPLDPLGVAIFSMALIAYRLAFDLLGHLLASTPSSMRRLVRGALFVCLVSAVAAWLWTAYTRGVLGQPMAVLAIAGSASSTPWFYPADNALDLLHALTNDGPILLNLLPSTAMACIFTAAHARRLRN